MTDALEDHEGTVSIGGRTITNLRFPDDIDGLAGEKEELANLVERHDKASTAYGMEISAEKTKLIAELQACPFPDVVFPPLPLSALSSFPFHCALQDGFGQT